MPGTAQERDTSVTGVLLGTLRLQWGPWQKGMTWECYDKCLEIPGSMQTDPSSLLSAYTWDACHQVTLSSDLSHLVAEIRALRGQLEQSIQGNNCLRLQLEQQLDGGSRKASLSLSSVNQNFPANTDSGSKQPLFQGRKEKGIRKPSASGEVPRMSVMEGTVLLLPHSLRSG